MFLNWRMAWIVALALFAGPAFALGLGQIQVRSQYGEPLLAEIPIVSSDPNELRQLQARLASPDTFARIGLQPPQGVVADLQFNVALDASGRPVIRVTTVAPVQEPVLTFLVEADWGQGRLVREYSALLDAPDTVAAPAQPPIQAPVPSAEPVDRIVRPAEPAPEAASAAEAAPDEVPAPAPPPTEVADADAVAPAPVAPAPSAPAATAMSVPGEYGPVQAGDTLSQIAQRLAPYDDVSLNQMMLALLRANPEAFIGGNVNLVRQGAVLRMPERDEALRLSTAEATAEVRAQVTRWRELSAPAPQPEAVAAGAADAQTPAAAGRTADARLEIVPPSASDGTQAGTRSGITAGGEGEMLRQELQETREALAARDAELEELKARLTDLEQLQQKQQQLITLKDSELAAVQQRLAESNQQPAPTLAQPGEAPPQAAALPWPWIGLGLALLIAAALAWRWARRGRPAPAPSFGAAAGAARPAPAWHGGPAAAPADPAPADPVDAPAPARDTPVAATPAHPAEPADADLAAAGAPADTPATGMEERLELAKAYIELGDVDTARSLLGEVAQAGNDAERGEAAGLLRNLS